MTTLHGPTAYPLLAEDVAALKLDDMTVLMGL